MQMPTGFIGTGIKKRSIGYFRQVENGTNRRQMHSNSKHGRQWLWHLLAGREGAALDKIKLAGHQAAMDLPVWFDLFDSYSFLDWQRRIEMAALNAVTMATRFPATWSTRCHRSIGKMARSSFNILLAVCFSAQTDDYNRRWSGIQALPLVTLQVDNWNRRFVEFHGAKRTVEDNSWNTRTILVQIFHEAEKHNIFFTKKCH